MRTNRPLAAPSRIDERGAALIVGVIFLLVMTMLGITAMQTTALQERMAGNMLDRGQAFQAAELALRAGEAAVFSGPPAAGTQGLYDVDTNPAPDETTVSNWASGTWNTGWTTANFPHLRNAPQFWIERRTGQCMEATLSVSCEKGDSYDITARSTGASGNATVILRSTALP